MILAIEIINPPITRIAKIRRGPEPTILPISKNKESCPGNM
jgi:hypothetical protein